MFKIYCYLRKDEFLQVSTVIAATQETPSARVWFVVAGYEEPIVEFQEFAFVLSIKEDIIFEIIIEQICKVTGSVPKIWLTLLQPHLLTDKISDDLGSPGSHISESDMALPVYINFSR